ncbi:ABC transporter ATP-binding protein/permease [Corynebacterium sp. P7202]|uniref:ABC transporter ATP-binding protein n=1 Tax=Corynebacterium pygosceleis TaxID=2800406 RepID=A0A9Q4C7V4_9CORY|nr:ABC transporter ATP-binding protein [Corynebacterium pygosceleis]MCK7637745.1 ABC transporter ATP-binding protein/permease [Corynebacterium pygosceleis]MCX7444715.1 ABC transporter ATP-binding protein [Corynebacterium pygosceleis]MCX7467926.1 ABC transporter ATP-binding protein [Corynebacterium pygosceleis]
MTQTCAPDTDDTAATPDTECSPPPGTSVGALIGKQKPRLIASGVLSVLGAFAGLVPYVVIYFLARDLLVGEQQTGRIPFLVAVAATGVAGKALLRMAANNVAHIAAYRALADIRLALAERLARMPLARAQARSSGEVKKVFQDDVEQLELGLSHAIPDIAASVTVPVTTLIIMFVIDWRMALAALVVVLGIVGCVALAVTASKDLMERESDVKKRLNVEAVSFVRGIRVIRGFVGSTFLFDGIRDAIVASEDIELVKTERGRVGAAGAATLVAISIIVILPLGLWLYHSGSLEPQDFVFFILVGVGFAQPLMSLTLSAAVLQYQIEAGLKNISGFLGEPDLPVPPTPATRDGSRIELRGARVTYGDTDVVRDIDLVIEPGERVAVVGGSGAGKSTLLRLIARFIDVSAGKVTFGGTDVRELDPAELSGAIAFVQQDDYIFNDTVLENIRLARPDATDEEVRSAGRRARVTEFIDELDRGWDTVLGSGGSGLSGGQRQRISIARALLADSPVVMLDEVTASLDATNERSVVAALAELQQGRTVITVAHRLGSLTGYDRILVMDDGRIVADGDHEELSETSDTYRRLWRDFVAVDNWGMESGDGRPAAAPSPAPVASAAEPSPDGGFADHTPPVRNLTGLGPVGQWFAMLGTHRGQLWRVGFWRLLLEGFFTSAPMVVVFFSLLAVLDDTLTTRDVYLLSGGLLLIFLTRLTVGIGVAKHWWPVAFRAISDLRRSVLRRLTRAPLGVFDRMDAGRTTTLLVSELALVDFINLPAKLIIAVVQPVLITVVLFSLDWRLAAAALIGVPFFLLTLKVTDRAHEATFTDVTAARREANSALLEFCRGTAVLRAFPDAPQAQVYRTRVEALRRASVRMAVRTSPMTTLGTIVLEAGFVAMLWLGATLFTGGSVSATTLLLFLILALNMYRPFQELLELSAYRHQQERIARSLAEVWDTGELPEPENPRTPADSTVEIDGVTFGYDDRDILHDVSFTAGSGTVTAVIGPSGAGKSTVVNLVARFFDPGSGAVRIGGVDLRDMDAATRRETISTVYQDVYLFPVSIRDNLTIGSPGTTDEKVWEALAQAEAGDFVAALPDGLDTVLTDGGTNLSGGQRQRLSIARALLKDAPVLLLDEAVAAVDPGTERRIQAAVNRLIHGRTVLVIAHRLNTIRNVDQIVVLADGRVDGVGTHDEIIATSPVYRELLGLPEQPTNTRGVAE